MHTVIISTTKQPADKDSYLGQLWKHLTESKKLKTRIYRIYVDDSPNDTRFVLMTTSKDLSLKLSSFNWQSRYIFAKFLEQEFAKENCAQLLVCFKGQSENSEEGLLVTKTVEAGSVVFTLAVAR